MNKKTGATPTVEGTDSGAKVLRATPVRTMLVQYRDGYGQEAVKLAAVIPGGEVYFFTRDSLDTRPAQEWLKKAILDLIKE